MEKPYFETVSFELLYEFDGTESPVVVELDADDELAARRIFDNITYALFYAVPSLLCVTLRKGVFDKKYRRGRWRKWTVLEKKERNLAL